MASEWSEKTLDDLGRIVTGKTPSSRRPEYFGGERPFITPTDMDGRRLIESTNRYLTEEGTASVESSSIPASSVMVSCIGSDMGKAALAGRDCVTNQQINSVIVDSRDDPLFIYYNLSLRKEEIRNAASGSAQPILNKSAFGKLRISLPPAHEQRVIAHILGTLDDRIELNRRMNETLEEMARAIFKSWFVDFDPVRAKAEGRDPGLPEHIADLFPDRFEDSELGEIPAGWKMDELGEVVAIHDSKRVPLSGRERSQRNGPYPYYGATSIMDYVDDYLFDGIYVLVGEDGSVVTVDDRPFAQYVWGKLWVNRSSPAFSVNSPKKESPPSAAWRSPPARRESL